jgi:integrase/recombinase XerD
MLTRKRGGRPKLSLAELYPHIRNLADPQGLYVRVQDYMAYLRERNYSEQTIATRELYLCLLLEWCGQRGLLRPSEITKPMLERYQRYLFHYRKHNGDPLSFRSQHGRIVAVRAWFKWLARQNLLPTNPASDLELPRLEKRLPKAILTAREAEAVLHQPDTSDPIGLRDRAILETLYSTGIRRGELVNLKVQDLDGERGTLMVRQGKGRKDRMIPIGERAVRWIDKYMAEVRGEFVCGRDDGTLFLSKLGDAMGRNNLTVLVRNYIDQARIGKHGACHLFRHTMATLMLENGADVRFIQAMLGHVSLATTEIYTQVSIKALKEIHTRTHPAQFGRKCHADEAPNEDEPPATEAALWGALAAEQAEEDAD